VDTGGTGGNTQAAYEWLRGKTGRRIFGVKGVGGWGRPIVASPSRKQSGKNARKVDLFLVGVDEAKLVVMRQLAVLAKGNQYCHFPNTRDPEFFHQLTAEKLITKKNTKGYSVRAWHQTRPRNEALDCRVYAYAALKITNPSLKRATARLNPIPEEIPTSPRPTAELTEEMKPVVRHTVRRSNKLRKNWVHSW
jgi:phage terminase large subunit GpA-like protein